VLVAELDDSFWTALGRAHGGVVASLLDTAATWVLRPAATGVGLFLPS
jgi:acyl-coenzyme A thioesterase PaaI-like protein